jgi:hypothetical protein
MTRRRRATPVRQDQASDGRQFTAEVILWAVRWYPMFAINCMDVHHTTMFRWIQAYAAKLEKRLRSLSQMSRDPTPDVATKPDLHDVSRQHESYDGFRNNASGNNALFYYVWPAF